MTLRFTRYRQSGLSFMYRPNVMHNVSWASAMMNKRACGWNQHQNKQQNEKNLHEWEATFLTSQSLQENNL